MGVVFSVAYLALFLGVGWLLAGRLCPTQTAEERLVLSGSFGLVLLMVLPALFALVLGFNLLAALLAGGVAGLMAVCLLFGKKPLAPQNAVPQTGFWLCVIPLFFLTVGLLHTHTLYQKADGFWCGQSTYGDLPMHLAFIQSLAQQGSFPPGYSLLAGVETFGYPFLSESVSSVFLLFGASLKFATVLPQVVAAFCVFGGVRLLAKQLLDAANKANLAYWLFFMGSGFGFVYFLGGEKGNFSRIFTVFYETPTNYVEENIRWVNPIADMMVPQRATLFGWALLFPALWLLAKFCFDGNKKLWPALCLLAAALPLVHTHSAVALVLVCAVLFLRTVITDRSKEALLPWIKFAAVVGCLWIPQFFTQIFSQTQGNENFLRLHFNWANDSDNYFWFYIKNIGLVYLLLIPAFLHAKKNLRWVYGGGLAILCISEFLVFQPNTYDNNKLLFVWHLLGCILVANLLVDWFAKIRKKPLRIAVASFCIFLATFGSVLTIGREMVSGYQQFGNNSIAAADYALEHTPSDALFLTGTQHLNPIASLAGRNIVCGSSSYVYFHGKDYSAQSAAVQQLYQTPSFTLLNEWNIDYVYISSWEMNDYQPDTDWFLEHCNLVFASGECAIFEVPQAG